MPSQVLFQAGSSEAWDQPVYLYLFKVLSDTFFTFDLFV